MRRHLACTLLLLLLVGCTTTPRFINHPEPTFTVDFSPFEEAGCPASGNGLSPCTEGSPLAALGCAFLAAPPAQAGALLPGYPLAQCLIESAGRAEGVEWVGVGHYAYSSSGQYFFRVGGMMNSLVRYVAYIDGQFTLLETEEEFRALFAPLESREEALGYVQAVTGLWAYYGLRRESLHAYAVRQVEDTHVDVLARGYVVHLYYEDVFGCGPHWTYAVDFYATREGYITQGPMRWVFRDTSRDGLCAD